jgi:hypothetical protein
MSKTPYSDANQIFSNNAHEACEEQVYPIVFGRSRSELVFRNTGLMSGGDGEILDGKMGVDWCVGVNDERLKFPIEHSIQERFRKTRYMSNHDLTITEHNERSGQPSELYKIKSGFFLYGYFDEESVLMREWVAVDTTRMLMAIHSGTMRWDRGFNPRSKQTFISIKFRELFYCRVLIAYKQDGVQPVSVAFRSVPNGR